MNKSNAIVKEIGDEEKTEWRYAAENTSENPILSVATEERTRGSQNSTTPSSPASA